MAKGLALDLAPAGITVNVVAPGWFDSPLADGFAEQRTARRGDPRAHRAAALGHVRRPRRARTSSSPRTRRRSSPAPCSTSTAGTCSYEPATRHRRSSERRSSRSWAPAARSARRSRAALAGEPDTDLVLSDVSDASLAGDDRRPDVTARGDGRDAARRRQRSRPGRSRRRPDGRALRPARRADQQRRRARAERSHPQPRPTTTGSGCSDINVLGVGQRHPRPRCRSCARSRSGSIILTASVAGHHRVVARRAVLRHQGRGDPARQGRGGRVRPRRHPRQLRVPRHVPCRRSTTTSRRRRSTRSPPSTRSGSARAADLVGAYSYLASDASRWTTGSAIVVDGGYSAP